MNTMRITLAAMAGTLVYLLWGWFVFEWLLGPFMASATTSIPGFRKSEAEASMLMLVISCLAYAVLLILIFERWAMVRSWKRGLLYGALIGVLVAVMTDSYWYATSHFFNSLAPVVADVGAAGLTVGAMGAVIGAVLGSSRR